VSGAHSASGRPAMAASSSRFFLRTCVRLEEAIELPSGTGTCESRRKWPLRPSTSGCGRRPKPTSPGYPE